MADCAAINLCSFELKRTVIEEMDEFTNTFELVDIWRQMHPNIPGFTWHNASCKIKCRLDYFFPSKNILHLITDCQVVSNIFSDHSALQLSLTSEEKETKRGPGFWKFNNSLPTDKDYTEHITKSIPQFIAKYQDLNDK